MRFAEDLAANGVKVIADLEVRPGAMLTHFMERAVRDSDYVAIVCTPTYAFRADNRTGGVGYETSLITAEIYASAPIEKFIPILRSGSARSSRPAYLEGSKFIDLREGCGYERSLTELVRHLWDEPEIPGFAVGPRPDLSAGFRALRARGGASPRARQTVRPGEGTRRGEQTRRREEEAARPAPDPTHLQAKHTLSWAQQRYHEVVGENDRIFDSDHRVTLASRHDWARRIGAAGDPAQAARLFAKLAADYTRVHGPDHRGSLGARRQQAWWTWQAGDAPEARRQFTSLNTYFTNLLGPEHRYSRQSRAALQALRDAPDPPIAAGGALTG